METIFTDQAPAAIGPYSQAIKAGNTIYASGQIPLVAQTGAIAPGGIEEQTEQVMKNIQAVLTQAGSDFSHVVKTTCFLKSMDDFSAFNEIYAKYFTSKPARSCVAVSALPKGVLVEVEVVAIVKE